ncbi:MAG: hypothetical protein FJZ96_11220 [Chloroflexi bacterium]|nr:hypothetical protein [Chloroflexota bacterium]
MRIIRNPWIPLALLASLAACLPLNLSEYVTEPGGLLFGDDFSDPESGWVRFNAPSGAMDFYGKAFRIWVNQADYDFWSTPGYSFHDVRVEVDAARLAGPVENRFGLVCRYRDAQNFYFFIISSDGYYGIGKVEAGERALLGQEMMAYSAAVHPGIAPNHLRADCVGNSLAFHVNDQPVGLVQDETFDAGEVGLLAGAFSGTGVDILFDDFMVYKP